MKRELEGKLYKDFPLLFEERVRPPTESLMCFGCDCNDGWYDILYNLCSKIMKTNPELLIEFRFVQIKEKFGTLRVYANFSIDEIDELIREAEKESAKTCELCGAKGKIRHKGTWLKTLCLSCMKHLDYERCKS